MNILELNPYIRRTMHSTILAPSHINRRIIFDYELVYIEEGSFLLTYNEIDFSCTKGDILFFCPNIPHSFHVLTTDLVQPHIHFDLQYDYYSEQIPISFRDYCDLSPKEQSMIRKNEFPHLKNSPVLKLSQKKEYLKLFYSIINTRELTPATQLHRKVKMLQLLEIIISENMPPNINQPSEKSSEIIPTIKAYIDSNYDHELTLNNLEQQFGYSKYYIEKLFKQEYGISVINYRNQIRMEKSVQLLKTHSVSETASLLGFSSIYAFSRAFRVTYGTSPTRYEHYSDYSDS